MQHQTETAADRPTQIEWPTILLIIITYGAMATLMWFYYALPFWVIMPLAGYLIALHGSLQHEVLHGHPTRNATLNELLVAVNFSLNFPYRRYRKLHLIHHNDENLTDPTLDPESYYLLPDDWAKLPAPLKQLYTINNTLAGRMIIGPIIGTMRFWSSEFMAIIKGDMAVAKAWAWHIPACAITLAYAYFICGIPLWAYLVMFAWPGIAFSLIRSFCEHQAVKDLGERTIVVESSPPLSLMFLNNNLHLPHHLKPRLAWYQLPAYYRAEREELLRKNHGYLMHGYREIFRRYFFKPKEPVAYPHPENLRSDASNSL
jgi:fatty acid desaturase